MLRNTFGWGLIPILKYAAVLTAPWAMLSFGMTLHLLFLLVCLSGLRQTRVSAHRCATDISSRRIQELEDHFSAHKSAEVPSVNVSAFVVPVHFHVVAAGVSLDEGNIPDSQIQASIDVLNEDFSITGVSFVLANTTRAVNPSWFHGVSAGSPEEMEMKNALRVGGAAELNVYTVGFTRSPEQHGFATYPGNYESASKKDGVVILYSTVPGGSTPRFNLGRTLTHQVGHWVGLYDTFQDGCDGNGDLSPDTPSEAIPSDGCPIGRDTCVDDWGEDPIHNFMDLSDDDCMSEFTFGQVLRLLFQMNSYRGYS